MVRAPRTFEWRWDAAILDDSTVRRAIPPGTVSSYKHVSRLGRLPLTAGGVAAVLLGAMGVWITGAPSGGSLLHKSAITLPAATFAALRNRNPTAIFPTGALSNGEITYYSQGASLTTQSSAVVAARGRDHIEGVEVKMHGMSSVVYTALQLQGYSTFGVSGWLRVLRRGAEPEAIVSTRPGSLDSLGITLSLGAPGALPTCELGLGIDGPYTWIGRLSDQTLCSGRWTYVAAFWRGAAGQQIEPSQFSLFINGNAVPSKPYVYDSARKIVGPLLGSGFLTMGTNGGGWPPPDGFDVMDLSVYTAVTTRTVGIALRPCCQLPGSAG